MLGVHGHTHTHTHTHWVCVCASPRKLWGHRFLEERAPCQRCRSSFWPVVYQVTLCSSSSSSSWKLREKLCFKMAPTPLRVDWTGIQQNRWVTLKTLARHWLEYNYKTFALQEDQDVRIDKCLYWLWFDVNHCDGLSFLRDFLPRGSGIVTRRPLVLQLISATAGGCTHIYTPTHASMHTYTHMQPPPSTIF